MLKYFQDAAGPLGAVNAGKLREVLTASGVCDYPRPGTIFDMETCRLLITMLDRDGNGTLNFEEFKEVHKVIELWKECFARHDTDRSGSVEAPEFSALFMEMGYNVPPQVVDVCMVRYSKTAHRQINFDDFIACAIRLRALSEEFKKRDTMGSGQATMRYEDFLAFVLRL